MARDLAAKLGASDSVTKLDELIRDREQAEALQRRVQDTDASRDRAHRALHAHGSLAMLEDVVEFYSEGGRPNPNLDSEIRPHRFSAEEKRALVAFLRSLTGKVHEGLR